MSASRYLGPVTAIALAVFLVGAGGASATTLCGAPGEILEGKLMCPPGEEVGADIVAGEATLGKLAEKSTAKLETAVGSITCNESSFVAELNSDGTSPEGKGITSWSFKNSESTKCPSTLFLKPTVEVKMEGLPYDESTVVYKSPGAPQGSLSVKGSGITVRLVYLGMECGYQPAGAFTGTLTNPVGESEHGELELTGPEMKKTSGGESCPGWIRFFGIWWDCQKRWSDLLGWILVPVIVAW